MTDRTDRQHLEALRIDRTRIYEAAVAWYRETAQYIEKKIIPWDELSDCERTLFVAVEKHENRKLPGKNRA